MADSTHDTHASVEHGGARHAVGPGIKEVYVTLNLLVVVAIIYYVGRKSIPLALKTRADGFRKRLVDSKVELDRYRLEIEKARTELKDLDASKRKILAETEEEGRRLSERLVSDAQSTATRILADAKTAAEDEVRSAVEVLRAKLIQEAVEQAKGLLDAPGSLAREKAHEKLMDQFFKDTSVDTKGKKKENEERVPNGN